MQYLKIAVIGLVLLGFQEVLFAQSYFDDFLKEEGLTFKKPEGYQLVVPLGESDDFRYRCFARSGRPNEVGGEFFLHNKDNSVVIMIQNYGYQDMKGILTSYYHDDSKVFYNDALGKSDTSKYPLHIYNSKELGTLNADGAVELTRNCDVPGNVTGYYGNRSIYVSKAYQGYFALIYLFKDSIRSNQDKIIEKTKNMLTYTVNKPQLVSSKINFEKHYLNANLSLLSDTLPPWKRGSIYNELYYFNREQAAFAFKDIVLSVQFPVNANWPYFNKYEYKPGSPGEWEKANTNYKQYLMLGKNSVIQLPAEKRSALEADDAYIFDFEHRPNDLYRDKYANCIAVLFHKNNIGTVILKYYYQGDRMKATKAIEQTLGSVRFKDAAFFSANAKAVFPY